MSGEKVANAFAALSQAADQFEIDGCAVNLEYVRDEDALQVGDLIPTLTLSLKRRERVVEQVPADAIDVETQQ